MGCRLRHRRSWLEERPIPRRPCGHPVRMMRRGRWLATLPHREPRGAREVARADQPAPERAVRAAAPPRGGKRRVLLRARPRVLRAGGRRARSAITSPLPWPHRKVMCTRPATATWRSRSSRCRRCSSTRSRCRTMAAITCSGTSAWSPAATRSTRSSSTSATTGRSTRWSTPERSSRPIWCAARTPRRSSSGSSPRSGLTPATRAIDVDWDDVRARDATADRNRATAYLMRSNGMLAATSRRSSRSTCSSARSPSRAATSR